MRPAHARAEPRPDAREAAREYIARRWAVVPVPPRSKKPVLEGWQNGGFTAEEVDPAGNVGVLLGAPSGGLADVDKDCFEAVAAWPFFGAATDRRHGRPGNPDSHGWYVVTDKPDFATDKYVDPTRTKSDSKKCTLIEIRGTGGQTIVPPSTHPDGDILEWESTREPTRVALAELTTAVRRTAACAMLAWRWPDGARHEASLSLAGLLRRGGMAQHDTERFVEAVARVAGDDEPHDRVRAVRDTYAETGPTTGGKRLADLLPDGRAVVVKLREWLGLTGADVELDDAPPLDVFGDVSLAGSPDLPLDALPDVIGDFASDTATRLGCDPASVALPAIVIAAAAIHDGLVVQPWRNDTAWLESARLWGAVVASSGDHKSPAMQTALRPLRDAEGRWFDDDRRALQRHEIERKLYARRVDKFVKAGGIGYPPDEPERPQVRRLVVVDATTEALGEILHDNPHGVLVYADELQGWLGAMDQYRAHGGRDRALFLEAWNGGPQPIDRVRRGRVLVSNWSACILGGIQPEPMRKLAGKLTDDGLLQRFLVVMARPSVRGEDREPDERACCAYRDAILRLVDLPAPTERCTFRLSEEAHVERDAVETAARNVQVLPDVSSALRAHLSKWPGIFARLLLTFHLLESHDAEISGDTARKAARLMLDFLLPHAARFYADVLGHEHLKHARWVAGYILTHTKERVTAREIGRGCHELYQDRAALFSAMETLSLAGWVTPIVDGTSKQATRWTVNPAVHKLFAERAAREREHREAVRTEIARAAEALGLSGGEA
jgi:hypothetical protein